MVDNKAREVVDCLEISLEGSAASGVLVIDDNDEGESTGVLAMGDI